MSTVVLRNKRRERRKLRVRGKVFGNVEVPRLSVFRSNRYIYAQLIDDTNGKTLIDVFDVSKEVHKGKAKAKAAFDLGKMLAERAKEKKIEKVVFDRDGYRYHGRVKSLAEGAREGGLQF